MSVATTKTPADDWLRSTLLHLRPLNSFHLAPVILFALSQASALTLERGLLIAFIMHALVYPSSCGYNSYFDRDTEATGGLKQPPPVHEALYWTVTGLDLAAIALAMWLHPIFGLGILICTIASRAYSNHRTRIKAKPILSYLWVVFFQGYFTYQMVYFAAQGLGTADLSVLLSPDLVLPAVFCSFLVAGSYPLTQVYQFAEDEKRGDRTISMMLGYRGTFRWCMAVLSIGGGFMVAYFLLYGRIENLLVVAPLFLPSLVFLSWWFKKVMKDTSFANHENAMRMSNVSAWCGNLAFLIILAINHLGLSATAA